MQIESCNLTELIWIFAGAKRFGNGTRLFLMGYYNTTAIENFKRLNVYTEINFVKGSQLGRWKVYLDKLVYNILNSMQS